MKNKIGIGLLIAVVLGYLIGNWIPFNWLHPTIKENPIELKDYYLILVQIFAAIATFLAVTVALFREEIRRWWEYVEIEYSIPEEKFVEVINPNHGNDQSNSHTIEAEKYKCLIELLNSGTIASHSSEIILESLQFKADNLNTNESLETLGTPINWGYTDEPRITIPPKGKKRVVVLELIPPDTESSPDGLASQTLPILSIAGLNSNIVNQKGTWTATYMLYSSNSRSKKFSVEIKWNGQWHGRKTEMNKCLTIELKN